MVSGTEKQSIEVDYWVGFYVCVLGGVYGMVECVT